MTLTPAIIAALDNYDEAAIKLWNADSSLRSTVKEQQTARTRLRECRDALLSVVAAEEGRKYDALATLVKEWQEAVKEEAALWPKAKNVPIECEVVDVWVRAHDRKEAALSALAQWEAS